jgi:transcriptional regulator GlxA family with amidase domain
MRMAFVLFDGMTSMDFIGFYEAITWLAILKAKENVSWTFCADKTEVTDDRGLKIKVDEVLPNLGCFDLVFIPGGISTRNLRYDKSFMGCTGGGVTAAVDLGLYMVEWLTNAYIATEVQRKLEYPYYQVGNLNDVYMRTM